MVKCGNGVYCTRTHDSLKISRGKWFWWSHGIGGHTALDYLIRVRGMRLPDAVEILAGTTCAVLPPPRAAPPQPEKRLMQLPHNDSCDRVRRYLTGRGLDAEIVDRMIAEGRIAEEKDHGFALFYGFDEREKPRQCSARATDGTAVKRDVAGSDRRFGFCLEAEVPCRKVWVFESAIDLLSFATLMKQAGTSALPVRRVQATGGHPAGKSSDGVVALLGEASGCHAGGSLSGQRQHRTGGSNRNPCGARRIRQDRPDASATCRKGLQRLFAVEIAKKG